MNARAGPRQSESPVLTEDGSNVVAMRIEAPHRAERRHQHSPRASSVNARALREIEDGTAQMTQIKLDGELDDWIDALDPHQADSIRQMLAAGESPDGAALN